MAGKMGRLEKVKYRMRLPLLGAGTCDRGFLRACCPNRFGRRWSATLYHVAPKQLGASKRTEDGREGGSTEEREAVDQVGCGLQVLVGARANYCRAR